MPQLWLRFTPSLGNFHVPWVQAFKKNHSKVKENKVAAKGHLRTGENFILRVKKKKTRKQKAPLFPPPPSRATVHIQVNDVNEYAPVFKEKSYKATVVEGKQYDSILRVEAVDADCSPQFSQICSYDIVTPDVPFTIDKDGEHPGGSPFLTTGGEGWGGELPLCP